MLWTRFKRNQENPVPMFNNGSANLEALITVGEILIESKVINNYAVFQGVVMIHNHAEATLTVDSTLNQVVHGSDIIYQCPIGKKFLFAVRNAINFSATENLDILVRVDNSGVLLFDVDSVTTMNNHIIRNGTTLIAGSPDITTFYILEY